MYMHVAAIRLLETLPTRKKSVIYHLLNTLTVDELREVVSYFNGHNKNSGEDTARIALLCAYSAHLSDSFPDFDFIQSHLSSSRPEVIELKPRHVLTRSLSDMTGYWVDCLDSVVFQLLLELLPNGWLAAIPVQNGYKSNIINFPIQSLTPGKEASHAISQ
jgi:hypothetical protein